MNIPPQPKDEHMTTTSMRAALSALNAEHAKSLARIGDIEFEIGSLAFFATTGDAAAAETLAKHRAEVVVLKARIADIEAALQTARDLAAGERAEENAAYFAKRRAEARGLMAARVAAAEKIDAAITEIIARMKEIEELGEEARKIGGPDVTRGEPLADFVTAAFLHHDVMREGMPVWAVLPVRLRVGYRDLESVAATVRRWHSHDLAALEAETVA